MKHYEAELACLVLKIFETERQKGYRYIWRRLQKKYHLSRNPKTILRYMHLLGISSPIRKKKFKHSSYKQIDEKSRQVEPNVLNREFQAKKPLEKVVTDVSYLNYQGGRRYLSVIKDLYDHTILAYQLSSFNDNQLVFDNLAQVFTEKHYECLIHSDQGFQYTNKNYVSFLQSLGITVSHSRRGNCYDNACVENFFSQLKCEELYLRPAKSALELEQQVISYIDFYNQLRPQEKLKGMTPLEFRNHA